jgi:hypothetical protein
MPSSVRRRKDARNANSSRCDRIIESVEHKISNLATIGNNLLHASTRAAALGKLAALPLRILIAVFAAFCVSAYGFCLVFANIFTCYGASVLSSEFRFTSSLIAAFNCASNFASCFASGVSAFCS